jgi:hypothetical protein
MPRINILTELKQANRNLLNAQAHLRQLEKILGAETNGSYYQNFDVFKAFHFTYDQEIIIKCLIAGYVENKEIYSFMEQNNFQFKSNLKYQLRVLMDMFEVYTRTALMQRLILLATR